MKEKRILALAFTLPFMGWAFMMFLPVMTYHIDTQSILSAIKEAQLSQERLIGELPLSVTCKK